MIMFALLAQWWGNLPNHEWFQRAAGSNPLLWRF